MERSKVYFTNMRTKMNDNLQQKLARLIKKAGIGDIDLDKKYVAIKIHFGEPGNLAYLRPNSAKTVADVVKELGGKPFLTDCNTLYVGGRKNALDHIESAYINGFTPYTTGCHILIGDGLKGTDDVLVPVEGGEYVKEAKIGRAIMDADVFISLSHFKGHECTGFGGALKNIGMGCGSVQERWRCTVPENLMSTKNYASAVDAVLRSALTTLQKSLTERLPLTTANASAVDAVSVSVLRMPSCLPPMNPTIS